MPFRMDVELRGWRALQRQMRGNQLYAQPFRELLGAVGQKGENLAATAAPKGRTGLIEARITHKVQARPLPLWVAVRSRARRRSKKFPRGFPYDRLLNFSPRHGHEGWFTRPLVALGNAVGPLIAATVRQIEQRWRNGVG